MHHISRITIFPIKALDGLEQTEAIVLPSGSLTWDRRLAIVDASGKYVNGKKNAKVHGIRSVYDLRRERVRLRREGEAAYEAFSLSDLAGLSSWFTDYFETHVRVIANVEAGWPDDTNSPGPTVISTATLETVASWFPGLTLADVRQRFRANLEVGDTKPFWEDRLYGEPGVTVRFRIGNIELDGVNPCQRCAVPPRSPITGEAIAGFQKTFAEHRETTLPPWAARSRFTHFYRLAVNTRPVAGSSGLISVGDEVRILAP